MNKPLITPMFLTAISLHINHKLKSLTPIDEWKDENIILQLEAWLSPNMGLNFNSLKKFLMGDIQNAHYITRLEKLTKAIKVFNNFNLTNEKKMEALTTPYFPVMNGEGKDRGVYWLSLRDILTDDNTYKEDTAHEIVEQYAYFISFQYKK